MSQRFEDHVAVVTGAGSGIGRASALAFAREGAAVVVADIDATGGEETVALVEQSGGTACFVSTDVSRADDVRRMVDTAVTRYGRLDVAHNNAGIIGGGGSIVDMSIEAWTRTIEINLTGVWLCLKHEIPAMRDQGRGAIVNTSSRAGLRGVAGIPAYVASKHGVIGLTRAAALEFGPAGIRINAVCPGTVRTAMSGFKGDPTDEMEAVMAMITGNRPIARLAEPEEIASAVLWLCSDEASFTTGAALEVDGGANAM
jgi:NAD(P)-dependent dehydrogenase (short-subunit alcohol dehydrogenase family)